MGRDVDVIRVSLIEAYYGCGFILDFSTPEAREAAFRLALMTILEMEGAGDFVIGDRESVSFDVATAILMEQLTPWNRDDPAVCRVGNSREYRLSVLSEDGSGLDVGPAAEAPNAWYDEFWDALRRAANKLEETLPGFTLGVP